MNIKSLFCNLVSFLSLLLSIFICFCKGPDAINDVPRIDERGETSAVRRLTFLLTILLYGKLTLHNGFDHTMRKCLGLIF